MNVVTFVLIVANVAVVVYALSVVVPSFAFDRLHLRLKSMLDELAVLERSPRLRNQADIVDSRARITRLLQGTTSPIGVVPLLWAMWTVRRARRAGRLPQRPTYAGMTDAEKTAVSDIDRRVFRELGRAAFLGSRVWPLLWPGWLFVRYYTRGERRRPEQVQVRVRVAEEVVDRTVNYHAQNDNAQNTRRPGRHAEPAAA